MNTIRYIRYSEELAGRWQEAASHAGDGETAWWAMVALGEQRGGVTAALKDYQKRFGRFQPPATRREAQRAVVAWEVDSCGRTPD
jgi:hypothetical protein